MSVGRGKSKSPGWGAEDLLALGVAWAYSAGLMEATPKSVLTDLQAFDMASLKGRLIELRRYL
jgi:hypothetical protein